MLRETIIKNLKSIELALQPFGLTSKVTEATVDHWVRLAEDLKGDWMSAAKYKLAAFFAVHKQQELPENPFSISDRPDFLLGGGAGRWLKMKLRDRAVAGDILLSLKQSKKGMTRPGPKELKTATDKYLKHMTEGERDRWDPPVSLMPKTWAESELEENLTADTSELNCLIELRRTVREIFQNKTITWRDRIKPFFPSTSANYINNRQDAGAVGTLLDHPELFEGLRGEPGVEVQVERRTMEEEEISQSGTTRVTLKEEKLNKRFETLWIRILKSATREEPQAKPVALSEALKVRMITKGPPFLYTAMRNIWKYIHNILRQHPTFSLIGEQISEEEMLDAMGAKLQEDEAYLSGDFRAATDNVKASATRVVAEEIAECIGLGNIEKQEFIKSLVEHTFDGKKQRTGQLMGSITSFPVLCLIVATVCRWSWEVTNGRMRLLRDIPLRVNGEDNVMKSKKGTKKIWNIIAKAFGLIESVGKTYESDKFIEMNSVTFERLEHPVTFQYINKITGKKSLRLQWFRMNKWVNTGLMLGMKRSGKAGLGDLTSRYANLSTRAQTLIRNAPKGSEKRLMKVFLRHHRKFLDEARVPWYIPTWLGGLGLPAGEWGGPSDLDRRIAHRILRNWKTERPQHIKYHEAPWKIWQIASERMKPPVYTDIKGQWTQEYDHAIASKCIDLLFDKSIKLEDLRVEEELRPPWKALRHNANLWKPRRERLPSPLTDAQLTFLPLYPNWKFDYRFLELGQSIQAREIQDLQAGLD